MPFADLSSEVSGNLPGLSGFLADDYVIRAWRKIRDSRLWSFLVTDDSLFCPPALTSGTYNITQFNNQVIANSVASAAFSAISPVMLPAQFLQLRFGSGTVPSSQIYNIVSVDTTVPTALVFTLDRVVLEPTNAASAYLCYRPYVVAPTADFLKWLSVVDMVNNWEFLLDQTSHQFDRKDPGRQMVGQAYYIGAYKYSTDAADVTSLPIYELWPGPTLGQTLYVRYRRQGQDFSAPTDTQPALIPDALIVQGALAFFAYPWASENQQQFPAMKGADWAGLIQGAMATYTVLLEEAKRNDDNQMMQSLTDHVSSVLDHP